MPWARLGDNSATYPKLMQIAGYAGADERAVNEVRGWLLACATQSAGHMTDYAIDAGTAALFGGARTRVLIRWCVKAGLLTPVKVDGVQQWVILNDPEFLHIRTRAEVEWDRQRKRDLADTCLTVPVRRRDGDNCRYCGVLVQWRGRGSNRTAELDHRVPGEEGTIETLVVACRRCNGARQDNPQWDDDHPLRPIPASPSYGAHTAKFLAENGYPTEANVEPDATTSSADHAAPRARSAALAQARGAIVTASTEDAAAGAHRADLAPADAASGARPGEDAGDAAERAPRVPPPPEVPPELPPKSLRCSEGSGSPGSGREGPGSGQVGEGRVGSRRRGGRGRRGRGTGSSDERGGQDG